MSVLSVFSSVIYVILLVYFFTLWVRFIIDFAQNFSRNWRPKSFALVLAVIVFTLTDPPIRAVRKILPAFRVGSVTFDFSWSVVMLVVIVLMYIALALKSV